jgi:hypothetical protein
METYKLFDIYGNEFNYLTENIQDAKECFIAQNGLYSLDIDFI